MNETPNFKAAVADLIALRRLVELEDQAERIEHRLREAENNFKRFVKTVKGSKFKIATIQDADNFELFIDYSPEWTGEVELKRSNLGTERYTREVVERVVTVHNRAGKLATIIYPK